MSDGIAVILGIIGAAATVATGVATVWAKYHFDRIREERDRDRKECREELAQVQTEIREYAKLAMDINNKKQGL